MKSNSASCTEIAAFSDVGVTSMFERYNLNYRPFHFYIVKVTEGPLALGLWKRLLAGVLYLPCCPKGDTSCLSVYEREGLIAVDS